MPSQGGQGGLTPCLNLQEQQAGMKIQLREKFSNNLDGSVGWIAVKTWPVFGVGDGHGWRGDGVGQGAGAGSIDSIDHQKPGESCCYSEWD